MQDRLQEIRDRLGKITQGKWKFYQSESIYTNYVIEYAGAGNQDFGGLYISDNCLSVLKKTGNIYNVDDTKEYSYIHNANFIANSPADIKFLLDAIDQAQERERVLRDALIEIEKGSCTRWISNIVNEALKEDKPNE